MIICNWDWGAITTIIAALITAVIAWIISNNWRSSKGSEVISNECKALWYELDKLEALYNNLTDKLKDDFYLRAEEWYQKNTSKVRLIKVLIETNNKNISSNISELSKFEEIENNFQTKLMGKHIRIHGRTVHSEVDSRKVIIQINSTKQALIPFIIYRK